MIYVTAKFRTACGSKSHVLTRDTEVRDAADKVIPDTMPDILRRAADQLEVLFENHAADDLICVDVEIS